MFLWETPRLYLRSVRPQDAAVMFDYRNNESCARYQRGQTKDRAGIEQLILRHADDALSAEAPSLLAVARKDTDEMIGEIVVMPREQTFSLGYTISYRYHRQGYAYEALSALLALLHGQYPGWEFICFVDPDNLASARLLRKLGCQDLGFIPSVQSRAFGRWITARTEQEFARASQQAAEEAAEEKNGPFF